jgi:glucose/arabinose dehydrogenase
VGVAFAPGGDGPWITVNERDALGDNLPPDYFTHIVKGDFFGWPYAYIGPHPDPQWGAKRPDMVAKTKTPDILFQAHSAPLGLVFYDASQFPAEYKGDAFVALHGSWNRATPTGYKVVRIHFANGKPVGGYDNFLTGFWNGSTSPAQVWGRPVGLALAKDGSLLVTDDVSKTIWRVSYTGK